MQPLSSPCGCIAESFDAAMSCSPTGPLLFLHFSEGQVGFGCDYCNDGVGGIQR